MFGFMFAVLTSSLGDNLSNETTSVIPFITNATAVPTIDFGGTCGVNFCSGSESHVCFTHLVPLLGNPKQFSSNRGLELPEYVKVDGIH